YRCIPGQACAALGLHGIGCANHRRTRIIRRYGGTRCLARRPAVRVADSTMLETKGLTKEFKGFVAVKDVSLSIRRGHIHALIGPNGAGKTTCFNLRAHILTPTRGQIFFNGNEITGSRPAAIARMGLVRSFQISAVFPNLTVHENVRIALQRKQGHSLDFWRSERSLAQFDGRASELIEAVGLTEFTRTRAVELPYGR